MSRDSKAGRARGPTATVFSTSLPVPEPVPAASQRQPIQATPAKSATSARFVISVITWKNEKAESGRRSLSKPSPSATRPPHRGEKPKYTRASSYGNAAVLQIVPEIVPASSETARTAPLHAPGALIRRQRFFSPTTMPATDWRTCFTRMSRRPLLWSLAR